jgi:hypothetical protein
MSKINSQHWAIDPEILEAFVLHRLDENEIFILAAHLEQCVECRQRVQVEKDLISGIRRYGRLEMKLWLKQQVQSNPGKRYDWTQAVSIAAAIILMFGAVFVIRGFVDSGQDKSRTRELVLTSDNPSQHALWITGRVITSTRQYKGTRSDRSNKFIVKKGKNEQTFFIHHAMLSDLPHTQQADDKLDIRTLLERTPQGLQLTLYMDSRVNSSFTGVEPITDDSLIVFSQGVQIAFHIPGGWAGRM